MGWDKEVGGMGLGLEEVGKGGTKKESEGHVRFRDPEDNHWLFPS